ncbi:CotH kinase family protein [Elizabethkingia meningoseptica]|uniref:CotH kinase family protein n=1 Tax=Elizabethkingia meningoseptica TaxID=238 RepID=UPI000995C6E8|nr:CotH kinase family protein [Elizabethkingia meningoseptica]AQX12686.1 hypothetical protein BBD35_10010 [Elizabethkingia meningoseptica]OPB77084.1 hypothetical protein BAY31_03425 [Elizabethkingia meningoseptica]
MDFIDEVIDQIRKETSIGGNRKERIANALQLLRDNSNNFKEPATVSRGKLSMRTDGENLYFTDSQNKEQEIILSDEFRASVNTGITGTAELNTVPSSTKYERWKIDMPGDYPNFIEKDVNGNNVPISISPKEFEENEITLSVTNGIAKKELSKKKDPKTPKWDKDTQYSNDKQVTFSGRIWESNSITKGDVPGVSDKWNEVVGSKYTTPVDIYAISRYIRADGGFGGFDAYIGSDKVILRKGEKISAKLVGEYIGNIALGVWSLDGIFQPSQSMFFKDNSNINEYSYTATGDCLVAVCTLRSGGIPIGGAEIGSFVITNLDINNDRSSNAVAGYSEFKKLKDNSTLSVLNKSIFKGIGYFTPEGQLSGYLPHLRFTDLFKLKAGDQIECLSDIQGILIFELDKKTVKSVPSPISVDSEPIRKLFTYTANAECYAVFQSGLAEGIPVADVKMMSSYFLTPNDIDNISSVNNVASYKSVKQLLDNNKTSNYSVSFLRNVGYNDGQGINPSVPDWRYSNLIFVPKGSSISAYLGTEKYDPNPLGEQVNVLIRVYNSDGVTLKTVVRGNFLGMGTVGYVTEEDCYIGFNSFYSSAMPSITINEGKIYATPKDITGGSGGGVGKFIPNITENNPKQLIKIALTTTDPIPEAKGTLMKGSGTIEIDNVKYDLFMTYEVQGSSSAAYPEKNWTIALYSDAGFTTSKKIRLANLLPYSKYVLKVNYIDPTHVRNIGALRIWEQMIQTRSGFPKRETDFALVRKQHPENMETGALGHVEGYPAILTINGVFYGIGTFNIGKDNDNYDLLKDDQTHIQIELANAVDFHQMNNIEVRVPKTVTALTNANIQKFATMAAKTGTEFSAAARQMLWSPNVVDFYLALEFFQLIDCVSRNTHIMSYNSFDKVLFTPYDWDSWAADVFGNPSANPEASVWDTAVNVPDNTIIFWRDKVGTEYRQEILNRYAYLRSCGVFSLDNFYDVTRNLTLKFERSNYEKDVTKWNKMRDNTIQLLYNYMDRRIKYLDIRFGYIKN